MIAFDSLDLAYTTIDVLGWLIFAAAAFCGLWALRIAFTDEIQMVFRRWHQARTAHHPALEYTSLVRVIRPPYDWAKHEELA